MSPHPTVFGPFYPSPLQRSVNHAERLSAVLVSAYESARCEHPSRFRLPSPQELWLNGRSSELETFTGAVLEDWRRGAVGAEEARAAIDGYIDSMHRGLRTRVTGEKSAACCAAEQATQLGLPGEPVPRRGTARRIECRMTLTPA